MTEAERAEVGALDLEGRAARGRPGDRLGTARVGLGARHRRRARVDHLDGRGRRLLRVASAARVLVAHEHLVGGRHHRRAPAS